MSTTYFPFGAGVFDLFVDALITKANPGIEFNGTEPGAIWCEMREVAGTFYIVKNAKWNGLQWIQYDLTQASYAFIFQGTGDWQYATVPASTSPITWDLTTVLASFDSQGGVTAKSVSTGDLSASGSLSFPLASIQPSWIAGGITPGGGSVYTSVKSQGAVGDGTTDDAPAINTAIATLAAAGGGTLFFPIGSYRCASTILLQSNVRLLGEVRDAVRLFPADGDFGTLTAGHLVDPIALGFTRNADIENLTLDFNAQGNLAAITTATADPVTLVPAAASNILNVRFTNRGVAAPATHYPFHIFAQASENITIRDCLFHDDVMTVNTVAPAVGAAGSKTFTPASMTNIITGMALALEFQVRVHSPAAITVGAQTITPWSEADNPFPNGGPTTGMIGIQVGSRLLVGSPFGDDPQETVVVTAITASTFTATFTLAHPAGCDITCIGQPEIVSVVSTTSTTFTCTTQLAHTGVTTIVGTWPSNDCIGGGSTTQQQQRGIRILGCSFRYIWNDCVQITNADSVIVADCTVYGATAGFISQGGNNWIIRGNTIDAQRSLGLYEVNSYGAGIVTTDGGGAFYGNPQTQSFVIADNAILGFSTGIGVYGQSTDTRRGVAITGNTITEAGQSGVALSGVTGASIVGNSIYRPNASHVVFAGGSHSNGAILILGSSDVLVSGNAIVDDRSTNLLTDGIYVENSARILVDPFSNLVKGQTGVPINFYPGSTRGTSTVNGGSATFSGNGSNNQFTFTHGLGTTPRIVQVTLGLSVGAYVSQVSADAANMYVYLSSAPAGGTNNVVLQWFASV